MRWLAFILFFQLSILTFSATVIPQFNIDSLSIHELPIELRGKWQFEFNTEHLPGANDLIYQVSLPNFWTEHGAQDSDGFDSFGFGRYTIDLIVPKPRQGLGLYLEHVHSAYRVLLNGELVYTSGNIGDGSKSYQPYRKPSLVSLPFSDSIHIVIEAANFDHYRGGILRSPMLVDYDEFVKHQLREHYIDMFIAGGSGLMGVTMLIIVLFVGGNKELLYFSLLSLVLCVRIIFSGGYPLHFIIDTYGQFEWMIRFEYIALFLLSVYGSLYTIHLFKVDKVKPVYKFYAFTGIFFALAAVFLPVRWFSGLTPYYLIILIMMVLTIMWTVIKGIRKGDRSALILAIGISVVVGWALMDSLVYFHVTKPSRLLYSLAFFLFILFNNLALIDRYIFQLIKSRKKETQLRLNNLQRLLMSMVSHEIKTPMAQLQMNLEMLEVAAEDPNRLANHSKKIIGRFSHSVDSIKKMMNDFVYFMNASIEDLESVTKRSLVTSLSQLNIRFVETFSHEFSFQTNLKVLIYAVRTYVTNAQKYTPLGSVEPHMELKHTADGYQLQIVDYGIGIKAEILDKLGQDILIKNDNLNEVNGIGFYLATKMLYNLNHRISIVSKVDKGTTVTISLT